MQVTNTMIRMTGALMLFPLAAVAQTGGSTWSGEAEAGIVATSGNTETQTINVKANIVNERDKWRHTGALEAFNNSDDIRTTAERYFLAAKSDYKIDQRAYLFGTVSYEDDRFAGFDYRATGALGYGRRVIERPTLTLDLEAGPGGRKTKFRDGESDSEFIVRLAGDLAWKLSDNANFTQSLISEIGEDVTITRSVSALTAQVVGSLAMRLSLTVRHTSEVPADTEKTDTETAFTLVYAY